MVDGLRNQGAPEPEVGHAARLGHVAFGGERRRVFGRRDTNWMFEHRGHTAGSRAAGAALETLACFFHGRLIEVAMRVHATWNDDLAARADLFVAVPSTGPSAPAGRDPPPPTPPPPPPPPPP